MALTGCQELVVPQTSLRQSPSMLPSLAVDPTHHAVCPTSPLPSAPVCPLLPRYWINPINIGQDSLMVTLTNGTQSTIGELYSYMTFSGM